MKKLIILALILLLTACGARVVEADLPNGFILVEKNSIDNYTIRTIQHEKTGCYYVLTTGSGTSVEQMFVEKNGVSVPYCTK
jgi:hypothetical protein